MTTFKLLIRSLVYYWRTNLAVLLGVVAGTAVIGGALIVGDSVRGSLRRMTLDRLGGIDHAVSGRWFFREDLASDLERIAEFGARFEQVAPAIAMQGAVTRHFEQPYDATADALHAPDQVSVTGLGRPAALARAGHVNVYGVDGRAWALLDHGDVAPPADGEVIVSSRLADALREATGRTQRELQPGDEVALAIPLPATIPRESLLGGGEQSAAEFVARVTVILPEGSGPGRLELNPSQQSPLNAFVNLASLQRELGLDARSVRNRKRRTRIDTPARVNALFVRARDESDGSGDSAPAAAEALNVLLQKNLRLADLHLRLVSNEPRGYLALESEQQILSNVLAGAARRAADKLELVRSDVLVYLANRIERIDGLPSESGGPRYSMYSAVAGLEFPLEPPFGPFDFHGPPPSFPLKPDEIILNDWLAADLAASPGDQVVMLWHLVGSHGDLPQTQKTFTVAGVTGLDGGPADDEGLTPEVEGITDAESFSDWERQPFPLRTELITGRDEAYWEERHATPKAFVQLDAAQQLWRSRYGELTAVRVAPREGQPLDGLRDKFTRAFFDELDPLDAGLAFQPVKYNGLRAASGTTDFAGLFFAFSVFLILSAAILIALLFRLGIERRATSIGLLGAVGVTPRLVRRLFLTEGLLVVVAGGLLGVPAAIGYASLMVYGLTTWWVGAIGTRFLDVYVSPRSLAAGFGIAVAVALVAIWWALRQLKGLSARELLAGARERTLSAGQQRRRRRLAGLTTVAALTLSVTMIVLGLAERFPAGEAFPGIAWPAVAFFAVGVLMLVGSLSSLAAWLQVDRHAAVRGRGVAGVARLASRNASRNRLRSVLTVGLIASATFVIVAVSAGHRNPAGETPKLDSGNGGFLLVGESAVPILPNLNTRDGREDLGLTFPMNVTDSPAERERKRRLRVLIDNTTFLPFRVKPGENASCLNLYQTRLPTILGVRLERMTARGGFRFVGAERSNPWTLLSEPLDPVEVDGRQVPVYPVFVDQNTLRYSLHKKQGETIAVPDATRPDHLLKIVAAFDGSVFQGVLVMSERNFVRLYPEQTGYSYFLIAAPLEVEDELSNLLESALSPYGFDAEPIGERLARFLAVQNTYLSTFQALGGLGLLVGTLGLATVMLRNVLERRGELALLRSVGFRNARLGWLVLWENALLLVWGLVAGTVSALLAMWPHLASRGADVPWLAAAALLAGVFVVGMAAAFFAVAEAVRVPIVETLRGE
ncbi:MAG TPA: ABC transporter permease [Planctomycetaceae bacterium]|nr:ABC transporter permease [Planctomycetaceae bacterium]